MAPPSHKKNEAILKQFQISVRIELTVFGVRIFSSSLWAVKASVIAQLAEAWTSVKNLSAHSTQGQSEKILQMLIRDWLKKNDPSKPVKVKTPQRKPASKQSKTPPSQPKIIVGQSATSVNGEALRQPQSRSLTQSKPRSISLQVRRTIWARDHGQCRLCKSRYAIQIDHIHPIARGGTNEPHNLRLLCRNCNLRQGIRRFGLEKMRRAGLKFEIECEARKGVEFRDRSGAHF